MLETPPETIWRLLLQVNALLTHQKQSTAQYANAFSHNKPHLNAAIRTALEMGLIDVLNKSEKGKLPVSSRPSLAVTSCSSVNSSSPVTLDVSDSLFLVRILRPLAAKHIVIETGFEAYVAGPVSKAFAIPALVGGFKYLSVVFPCIFQYGG